ncbi:MAG TPA: hypothetical protein DCG54_05605 [Anaerolineae bacterium]|jgi:hypothetical protein|nr:hypothetical protein [Anaerolineae bacterium]
MSKKVNEKALHLEKDVRLFFLVKFLKPLLIRFPVQGYHSPGPTLYILVTKRTVDIEQKAPFYKSAFCY